MVMERAAPQKLALQTLTLPESPGDERLECSLRHPSLQASRQTSLDQDPFKRHAARFEPQMAERSCSRPLSRAKLVGDVVAQHDRQGFEFPWIEGRQEHTIIH